MSKRQANYDNDTDDMIMNDDADFVEDVIDDEQEERIYKASRAFNMTMRHRIEERLEQRRLMKDLGDYDLVDLDDDDTLH